MNSNRCLGILQVFHCVLTTLFAVSDGVRWAPNGQPKDTSVVVGGQAKFNCTVDDLGNAQYFWNMGASTIFLNGQRNRLLQGFDWSRYRIEGKNNLVIDNVQESDESSFACVIFGFDSVQVYLTVWGLSADVVPPTPTLGKPFALHYNIKDDDVRVAFVKLERKHGNENSFVDLVLFDGRSRNITYLDTSLISITTATSNFSVGSNYLGYKGRRSLSLTFINAQCNDSGQYRWVMHYSTQFGLNRILESISNVTLNVQATLSGESDYGVTIQPGSDLKEGSALEVKCKADVGNHPNGELTMHYHFPNGTLYRFPTTKLKSERKCSFVQEVVLDLLAVSIKDNGTSFRCILQQGNHTEYVESNPINVLYPPSWVSISRSPDRQVYTEGENVVFNCTVATNPPSSIIWKINNSVVGTTPALFLHNIQRFNAGEYTCEAHYDNVVYTSYIRLSVKGHLTHTSTASLPVTPTAKNNLPTNIVSSSTGIPLHPSSAGHPTTTPATSGTCNDYPGYPCDSMVKLNLCADNYIAAVYCQNTCQRCDPPVIIGR